MVSEEILGTVLLVGIVLILIGWFWLVIRAFGIRLWWGLATLFVPPVMPLIFALWFFRRVRIPATIFFLGILLSVSAYGANWAQQKWVGLGPHEQLVDGERHLTLTGWDRTDYGVIRTRPDVVVLQMANPDVTDETLKLLEGFQQLKELDLNDTKVTDAGLPLLIALPALKTLRMKGTAITDEGFQQHLAEKETLSELDLRGTEVAAKTLRSWKNAQPGRQYLK